MYKKYITSLCKRIIKLLLISKAIFNETANETVNELAESAKLGVYLHIFLLSVLCSPLTVYAQSPSLNTNLNLNLNTNLNTSRPNRTRLLAQLGQIPSQAVILQYHHVGYVTPPSTSTNPEDFRRHLEYLRDNNFQVLPLEEVLQNLKDNKSLPELTAVITFDDAYRSIYEFAVPILAEFAWPFTIFVTTDYVKENSNLYLNWQEVNELAAAGATIANHTVSHPSLIKILAGESERTWELRVSNEIIQAEEEITARTGQSHKILAYPYGEYNISLTELISELGFSAVTQNSGPINASTDFTALSRFPLSGLYASMERFPDKVNSLVLAVSAIKPKSPETLQQRPVTTLTLDQHLTQELTCYNNDTSISVTLLSKVSQQYIVEATSDNQSRRFRYNCTSLHKSGRYFWYSIPWINVSISNPSETRPIAQP